MQKYILSGMLLTRALIGQEIEYSSSGGMNEKRFEIFKNKYNLNTFIETGTYYGETAYVASHYFSSVYTIELSDVLYEAVSGGLNAQRNVHAMHGYSEIQLEKILARRGAFSTFIFLDAHGSGGITTQAENDPPMMEELMVIAKYARDDTVTIIDDIRCFFAPLVMNSECCRHYPKTADLKKYVETHFPKNFRFVIIGDQALVYNPSKFGDTISHTVDLFTDLFLQEDRDAFIATANEFTQAMSAKEKEEMLLMADTDCHAGMIFYAAALIKKQSGDNESAQSYLRYAARYGLDAEIVSRF